MSNNIKYCTKESNDAVCLEAYDKLNSDAYFGVYVLLIVAILCGVFHRKPTEER